MDVNPHSAYHAAGIKLLPGGVGVNDVACSGGIGGVGAPHCAPGLTTHCALRTRAFPSVALSMHPLPQRDAYPSGCDGSRNRAIPGLQNPGLPPISTHPTILFWLGNLTQGRTDALLPVCDWRFSGCTSRAVTCSFCGRLSHRPPTERTLKLSARVGGLSVADVPLGAVTDHFGLIRSPGGFFRLWLKNFFHRLSAPTWGKKSETF